MNYAITSETKSCKGCGKPLPEGSDYRRKYCEDCNHIHRLASWKKAKHKSYKKHRKAILLDRKEEYQWYKKRGICVDCHAADAVIRDGVRMTRCAACMERQRLARLKRKKP